MCIASGCAQPMTRPFSLPLLLLCLSVPALSGAQTSDPPATAPAAQTSATPKPPDTADPQVELNLISLPTTQSIKRHHGYFRLNHRFARDLRVGDFGDLAADLFA